MLYRLSVGILAGVVILASALASLKSWVDTSLDSPMAIEGESHIVQVPSGSSLSLLSRQLVAEGLISSRYPVLIHSRMTRLGHIKAGEYEVPRGQTQRLFLERLVAGDTIKYRITFPEGRSLATWLQLINSHPKFENQLNLDMVALSEHFSTPAGDSLEGWFFPDTYTFTADDDGLSILTQAHASMVAIIEEEWAGRSEGLPIDTPYEALILASIIEKETGVPEERSAIAGVFTRRLQLGMRLQTDPTIIYGLGENYDGNLTREHLKESNPYNTYQISGLPPTPITNPGREAIHAALHPLPGEELFFVARGDGSHHFSATLAEHERAVRQYQLQRVKNYRSSPN